MITDERLRALVDQVVSEMLGDAKPTAIPPPVSAAQRSMAAGETPTAAVGGEALPDIARIDLRARLSVPDPENAAEYLRLKARTPARLGVHRAGTRYRTETLLRLRADHAAAMDAVFTDVDEAFLARCQLPMVATLCATRDEFLTRPDLGRRLPEEAVARLKALCKANPQVQVFAADGLSSSAITANLETILPAIEQGLRAYGMEMGTPFFVKYGRVGVMDVVTEALGATITVVLIGERPGLATGESMSAYMTYKGRVGMPEAGRTVLSNIHAGGTPAAEAGAHIAHILKEMMAQGCSGLELKL